MLKLRISKKEAREGCRKKVRIPGTGKAVMVNIRPGEKGNRCINVNDPAFGPEPIQIIVKVRFSIFIRIIIFFAVIILIGGIIAKISESAGGKKPDTGSDTPVINQPVYEDDPDLISSDPGSSTDTDANTDGGSQNTDIDINITQNTDIDIINETEIKVSRYPSAIIGRWITEYGDYFEFFSNGQVADEDGNTYPFVLDGSRLSVENEYDRMETCTVTMTENTMTLVDEDYDSRTYYRLEGNNYPTPDSMSEEVISRALRKELHSRFDCSTESEFIDSGKESNGVSYARFNTKLYYNYRYLREYDTYDVVCLWSGAVGRWFFRSGEMNNDEVNVHEWYLDGTEWQGDGITIEFESFDDDEFVCLWTYDGVSNKESTKMAFDSGYSWAHLGDYMLYLYFDDGVFFGKNMAKGEYLTQVG